MEEKGRRLSRERALLVLYRDELLKNLESSENVDHSLDELLDDYARLIVNSYNSNCEEIDELIVGTAREWGIERMPEVDRAILRIAVTELRLGNKIPTAVILSEAVEIADIYSKEDSKKFINGVLAAIAATVRK